MEKTSDHQPAPSERHAVQAAPYFLMDARTQAQADRGNPSGTDPLTLHAGITYEQMEGEPDIRVFLRPDLSPERATALLRRIAEAIAEGSLDWCEEVLAIIEGVDQPPPHRPGGSRATPSGHGRWAAA